MPFGSVAFEYDIPIMNKNNIKEFGALIPPTLFPHRPFDSFSLAFTIWVVAADRTTYELLEEPCVAFNLCLDVHFVYNEYLGK